MSILLDLKSELDRAREQYDLCQYIDDYPRLRKEQNFWLRRIEEIEAQLAEFEGDAA